MFIKRNIINLFDLEYYLYSCMALLATLCVASMETLYRSLKFRSSSAGIKKTKWFFVVLSCSGSVRTFLSDFCLTRVNFFTTQEQPSGSACDQKVDGIKT